MFIENILILHKSSNIIIFNKKPQFINDFWERFCKIIDINKRFLMIYYLQIDKMTERMNLTIKTYFRIFVN